MHINLRNKIFAILKVLFLGGCTQWYWVSDSRPIEHLSTDFATCNEYAYRLFPAHIVQSVETNFAAVANNAMLQSRQKEYERQKMEYENALNNRSWSANTTYYKGLGDSYNSTSTIRPDSHVIAPTPPSGFYLPDTHVVTRDINLDARNSALRKCMNDSGWRLEERSTLRW